MPRMNRRTKVISIRLSDEEFEQLQSLCTARGADSISELARNAMKLLLLQEKATENGHAAIEVRVNEMHTRMTALDREVTRLSSIIGLPRVEELQS